MRLAFLGTGSAFSLERYNGAVVVDGRILLDAGAPLLPHLHRLGIDPSGIEALFLTHFHGDHILGLPPFMLHRALVDPRPFTIVGPAGVEAVLERLFELCWGDEWAGGPNFRERSQLSYREAGDGGEVAGLRYEPMQLEHGARGCTGYRLHMDGRILAYAGDTTMSAPLEKLVDGAYVAVTEATSPGNPYSHTSWEEALGLAARHPGTRFFFNHLYEASIEHAASDLEVVDV